MDDVNNLSIELLGVILDHENQDDNDVLISRHLSSAEKINFKCPDFPSGKEWFNVLNPVNLKELEGKVVVLDFFTYCCINCMHILPALKRLESLFPVEKGLVIIGVHSAKFDNEKISENIRNAVQRYNISHAVINDDSMELWNELMVSCWPTLIVVSPTGQVLFTLAGEKYLSILEQVLLCCFKRYEDAIKNHAIPLTINDTFAPDSILKFPGKLSWNENRKELAISDTGHNRIVVTDESGGIKFLIGCGEQGFQDGKFECAKFDAPQGLCWLHDLLFVADTCNHRIRVVDFASKRVVSVAGTGVQGEDNEGGLRGTEQPISSPWDVMIGNSFSGKDDVMLIAVAGTHQIWSLFLEKATWFKNRSHNAGDLLRFVGSGHEENRNNSYPHKAGLAQPSGISMLKAKDGLFDRLLIADSESSTVRSVSMKNGAVTNVVGGERDPMNLFGFGDVDGVGLDVKLQHPLHICAINEDDKGDICYVADSYNHKIKLVYGTRNCVSLIGSGVRGSSLEVAEACLNEPGGLCRIGSSLLIADTNNHRILLYETSKLLLKQIEVRYMPVKDDVDNKKMTIPRTAPAVTITKGPYAPGSSLRIRLKLKFEEEGVSLTKGAPSFFCVFASDDSVSVSPVGKISITTTEIDEEVLVVLGSDTAVLTLQGSIYYCLASSLCKMKSLLFLVEASVQPAELVGEDPRANIVELTADIG